MSTAARLAGFAAAVAAVFALAFAVGSVAGVTRGRAPQHAGSHEMVEMGTRLRMVTASDRFTRSATRRFAFAITTADGSTVKAFDMQHTKRMHLIVVRRDMTGFQHLHPVQAADGSWSVPLRLDAAGSYVAFADFKPKGGSKTVLTADLQVPGSFRPQALPAPATITTTDGYAVRLAGTPRAGHEGSLRFSVTQGGRNVTLQPYLGARGHLVALREGDLSYLHVHPLGTTRDTGPAEFMVEYPSPGRYRLFLQFRHAGAVHTASFTQVVAP